MTPYDPTADDVVRRILPRVVSTPQLLRLEQISRDHGFSQNLDPSWPAGVIADEGRHILTPALTHPSRSPNEAAHLRSLLRVQLRTVLPWTDAPAMLSLLDLQFEVFESLPEPTVGVLNWIADLTTEGVPSQAQVAEQQELAQERSVAKSSADFPIWGTITWLTSNQGGRRGGPPLTPGDTYYRATAFVAPSTLEDGLTSVVVNVSVRNAWQSHAKLRWLVPPGPAVGRGSCIFITEGPKTVALFRVEHVEVPVQAERPAPLSAQRLAEIESRQAAATPGPWRSMVEGRDHRSGDSFLMTGGDDHRGPDMYLTWDPVIHEDRRRADQDFIAHARQDIPALAAEIRRLREQLLRPLVADEMATYEMIQATNAASGTSQIAQLIKNVLDRPGLYLMGRSLKDYANIVTGAACAAGVDWQAFHRWLEREVLDRSDSRAWPTCLDRVVLGEEVDSVSFGRVEDPDVIRRVVEVFVSWLEPDGRAAY